jgi:hypothetical protein
MFFFLSALSNGGLADYSIINFQQYAGWVLTTPATSANIPTASVHHLQ